MKIIVNADDFGLSHEKNVAIDKMMRQGVCMKASLVVNTEYTEEAVEMAIRGGYGERLSLHINLTEGRPLSTEILSVPLYCTPEGSFQPRYIIKHNAQIMPFHIAVIRKEIACQIEKFQEYGFKCYSVDSHNWVHLRIPVWLALKPLIKKYDIKVVRPMFEGYKRPEIASKKWSRYFSIYGSYISRHACCKKIRWTSNLEQFLLAKKCFSEEDLVEVFTHPVMKDGNIIDGSSWYNDKGSVHFMKEIVDSLATFDKVLLSDYMEMGK